MITLFFPTKILALLLTLVASLLTPTAVTARELGRNFLSNHEEIFDWADADKNNNINSEERDRLRYAFGVRGDLRILDVNNNGKLDREEINALEAGRQKIEKKKKKGKENGRKGKR